jgi:hypothetical protein
MSIDDDRVRGVFVIYDSGSAPPGLRYGAVDDNDRNCPHDYSYDRVIKEYQFILPLRRAPRGENML